ncbi:MAG: hypothetical protein ACKV22_05075 [Bryobacteraceae bacterium]
MDPDIQRDFPDLTDDNHTETSPEDFEYNCLAFVLGDLRNWWEPPGLFGHYWPDGFSADVTVDTAVSILKLHGYIDEVAIGTTPDVEAVAVYAEGSEWTHFAKFSHNMWFSKLGGGKDISHERLESLEGYFGKVVRVLAKQVREPQ